MRLVAYLIPSGETVPADDDLRAHSSASPCPTTWCRSTSWPCAAFPLTPNGKVDRKALPAPMLAPSSMAYVAPRNDAERLVAQVLQDALGMPRLGVHDNFFDLGGHSLLAAQVLARLAREHRIALGLRDMFEAPTVESLARLIERRTPEGMGHLHAPIPRREDQREAPASLMQQRLGFLEQLTPGQSAFNVPSSFRLRGRLDVDALERALNEIVRRHASIRTTFRWDDSGLVQVVAPELEIRLKPLVDLEGHARQDREVALQALLREKMRETFDLVRGPLFRATLFRLDPEEHVLSLVTHHMVWDGWSFDIYRRELDALYAAFRKGRPSPLADVPISYGDFAAWQRQRLNGPALKPQVDYWTKQLAGPLEPLDLPGDHARPALLSEEGDGVWVRFSRQETDALTALARRHDCTLFMLMLAAFKVLLYRHSGQRDVRVGAPVRARVHHDTQDLIGFFVNTLVLRSRLDPGMTFADLLASVRTTTLEALGHEEMPFELLLQELQVRRDPSRSPITQHLFSFQEASGRSSTIGDLKLDLVPVLSPTAQTDLTIWLVENREGLSGALNYSTDLFERTTIQRMLGRYRHLLESVLRDPQQPIGRLELLPADEVAQIAGWNSTNAEYPSDRTVCQIVTAQAARAPEQVAVEMDGARLTYQDLERGANRLARRLRGIGVRRGSLVGLCVERSPQMVVAMQGILRAGRRLRAAGPFVSGGAARVHGARLRHDGDGDRGGREGPAARERRTAGPARRGPAVHRRPSRRAAPG